MNTPTETEPATETRWPLAAAQAVAAEIASYLRPHCSRLEIAGSIRRKRETVGDVEIVFVSNPHGAQPAGPNDLFADERTQGFPAADSAIAMLERIHILGRRKNAKGVETFGPKNKYMVHLASGIPVDLFATTEECWHNYLVCRTGPAEHNVGICMAARRRGWSWRPYGEGFESNGRVHRVTSERDLYDFLKLPFREPHLR
jgi:DNA polymerase (family X)